MNIAYTLTVHDIPLTHGRQRLGWLHDGDDVQSRFNEADALVASGDYFGTLATALDKLAQLLPYDSAERVEVEQIINNLLYLEPRYDIVRKPKLN